MSAFAINEPSKGYLGFTFAGPASNLKDMGSVFLKESPSTSSFFWPE
jgi:hypothetical protein